MAGLTVQNFVTPAVGICALVALIRGIIARSGEGLGQLLAGPGPQPLLRPAAALDHRRPDPRLPGRAPDAGRRRHRDHARGRQPDAGARPGRLADRDQAARAPTAAASSTSTPSMPFENPHAALELRRDAVDHPDPGGAHLHLRAHGRPPAPGLGDLRRDADRLGRVHRGRSTRPSSTARPPSTRPARRPPRSTARPAATSRARSSATGSRSPRSGRRRTTVTSNGSVNSAHGVATPASAAPCRCPAWARAR